MSSDLSIQTTHVGSLPRSDALRELLRRDDDSRSEAFEAAVSEAVRDVVRKQAEAGIDVANDGEQSRLAYSVDVTNRLSGYSDRFAERDLPADLEEYPEFAEHALGDIDNIGGPIATGPIEYVGEEALERDLARFDEALEETGVSFSDRFHTAPSPGAVLRFTDSTYHDSNEAYIFDLAESLRTEYEIIVDSGAQLQIDAPELLAGFTITYKDASTDEFCDQVETYVEAINVALGDVPSDRVRLHACWGNYPGPHHHDVALGDVIDKFYEADVSGLVVEGANPRHNHEYRTIAEHPLPDDWTLVPGVIDVKTNIVEHPEVVADRLERFAESVGDPSRIVAGCDCGFETVMTANLVYPALVWKKLESLVQGAELASNRLA
ncbi:cobalamin-independent methionine synthase II family protein [Natronosalvus halobius]|uniref:cobalamin-independent methionine synthase II family protein n=1 Tax=Natronosalvus halobius TaxID=2953746 RepID=UPI00209F28AF|nr:cobalamin-independent methionine synthase II family protein [Natronosalvus halobius]USZ71862.1 cobalamin-independent methionine synthase II family protein [Natronosalvus halobius]